MEGAQDIKIGGSLNDSALAMSISISWRDSTSGTEHGLESNETHWRMYEAGLRGKNPEDWIFFEIGDMAVSGERGPFFAGKSLVLPNDGGSEVVFENIILAPFLPWDQDQLVMEARKAFSLDEELSPSIDTELEPTSGVSVETAAGENFEEGLVDKHVTGDAVALDMAAGLAMLSIYLCMIV